MASKHKRQAPAKIPGCLPERIIEQGYRVPEPSPRKKGYRPPPPPPKPSKKK